MAYSESKKLTDTEKRLEALKIQLFGKEENRSKIIPTVQVRETAKPQDLTYFRHDLLKILLLATLIISAEIILYLQFTFKILRFN